METTKLVRDRILKKAHIPYPTPPRSHPRRGQSPRPFASPRPSYSALTSPHRTEPASSLTAAYLPQTDALPALPVHGPPLLCQARRQPPSPTTHPPQPITAPSPIFEMRAEPKFHQASQRSRM